MSLIEKINIDLKEAILTKNKLKLESLCLRTEAIYSFLF